MGGYQPVLRYAEADNGSVEDAIAAAPLSLTNLPGESDENHYCAVVSAVDRLGNESGLPDEEDGMCLMAGVPAVLNDDGTEQTPATEGSYEALLRALVVANALEDDTEGVTAKADAIEAAMDALADAGLLVGVDITPPGIEIDEDDRIATGSPSMMFDVYDDEHEDFNSGLHSLPLLASVQKRDTDDTDCLDISDDVDAGTAGDVATTSDDCDDDTALPNNTALEFAAPDNAYHTVSGTARDKAGNHSAVASHTFVFDDEDPRATIPAVPGAIVAGTPFEGATFLNDDLSIRDYYGHAEYGTDFSFGIGVPVEVDDFDADPLTNVNVPVTATVAILTTGGAMAPYKALQTGLGEPPQAMSAVDVFVRDQASDYENATAPVAPTGAPTAGDDADAFNTGAFTFHWLGRETVGATDTYQVCALPGGCGDDSGTDGVDEEDFPTALEIEIAALAPAGGTFRDPFERVDFWVQDVNGTSWYAGSDTSGTSGREDGDIDDNADNDRFRTWTYSVTVPGALVAAAYRSPTNDLVEGGSPVLPMIRVVGVNDENIGLVQASPVDISTEEP